MRKSPLVPSFLVLGAAGLCWAYGCSHPPHGGASSSGTGGGDNPGTGGINGTGNSGMTGGSGPGTGGDVVVVPMDGGVDAAVTKTSCGSATVPFPYSTPYVPSAADLARVDTLMGTLNGAGNSAKADQLRSAVKAGNNYDVFDTPDSNSIRGFSFRDGPRGANLAAGGINSSSANYSTAYPVAMARGAAFDLDLEYQIGKDMGEEMAAAGHTVLLAPTVNILRHPLWGRAQETYGEDSFQLGRLGAAFTLGVQEYISACVKHFAANNIEADRSNDTAKMDEQTLREIYARHFEMIVKDGGVSCVMASYNNLQVDPSTDKTPATASKHLLTDILRTDFGFKGFTMSDWWAINHQIKTEATGNGADAISAGLDVEMPWNLNFSQLETQVSVKTVSQDRLDEAVRRVLLQKVRFKADAPGAKLAPGKPFTVGYDKGSNSITNQEAHVANAQKAAIEGMVLLKNDADTLPLDRTKVKTVAVLGRNVNYGSGIKISSEQNGGMVDFAKTPRTGDIGSSRVFIPDYTSSALASATSKSSAPFDGFQKVAGTGVSIVGGDSAAAAKNAKADVTVVVAGLTPLDEGEEYTGSADRSSFALDAKTSAGQTQLIMDAAADATARGTKLVVVLEGGSVIDMPWLSSVPAVVMAWYPGQDGGRALAKLIFGDANFSGKLPITWPAKLADEPEFASAGGTTTMDYYLGYRHFDKKGIKPLFAFGAGLSYTKFEYSNLVVPCTDVNKDGMVNVQVNVSNTGTKAGDEVVFLFVSYPNTTARRSMKELKGFRRVSLDPGVTKQIAIPLRVSDLKYWDSTSNAWVVESGPVKVMVGGSSDNLTQSDTFTVK